VGAHAGTTLRWKTRGPDAPDGRRDHGRSGGGSGRGHALRGQLAAQLVERAPEQAAHLHRAEPHGLRDLGLRHVAAEPELDELLVPGGEPPESGAHDDALVEGRVGPRAAAGVDQVEDRTATVRGRRVEGGGAQVGRRDLGLLDGIERDVELVGELAGVRVVAEPLLEP